MECGLAGRWTTRGRTRLALALAAAACCLGALPGAANAAGPNAVENLSGCTANTFAANDDQSVLGNLGFTANFYGTSYTMVSVNNNGNVTFGGALSTYTPFDFTTTNNVIIAPYLADVDTRSSSPSSPNRPVTYGSGTLPDGTKYFCVDWVNVGYYAEHDDKLNSFQLILSQPTASAGSGNFEITFNYDQIQWETGDASEGHNGFGGTPAAVGYSAGDGVSGHDYIQPGSFTSGALEDSNGSTGLIHNSIASNGQLGRYVFEIVNGPVSGGRITGTVHENDGTTTVPNAPVSICRSGGGACVTRQTNTNGVYTAGGLPPGNYDVTAHADNDIDPEAAPTTIDNVAITNGNTTTQDISLGAPLSAPPNGTTVTGQSTNPDGIPVVNWNHTGTLTTIACGGAALNYKMTLGGQQIAGGPMTQVDTTDPRDGSAHYQATYPTLSPNSGNVHVAITGTCPVAGSPVDDEFDMWIDPSGTIVDTGGNPIGGATVTVLRSESASGPFVPIPTGSAEMSPANRVNPDVSLADGSFGWDVVAGFYRIDATKAGCVSAADHSQSTASTSVLQIPPPATNLVITMFCPSQQQSGGGGTPPGGSQTGGTTTGQSSGLTTAQVEQIVGRWLSGELIGLLRQLRTQLTNANVRSFTVPTAPVTAGTQAVKLTMTGAAPRSADAKRRRAPRRPRTITIATGRLRVLHAGRTRIRITLTRAGRSALQAAARRHQTLRLKVADSFTPLLNGHSLPAVQAPGTLKVKPRVPHKKRRRHH